MKNIRSLKKQGGWIGAAITAGAALLGNRKNRKADKRYQEQGFANSQQGLILGNKLDLENQQAMERYRYNMASQAGLTPWEYYGSGASSAAGGTSGSGAVLGNAANQQSMAAAQREKDRSAALRADLIKAGTALQQTKMQTDAQKEIASQQVGATTRGQDIQKAIAEGRLNLDRDTYKLNVKSASANIRKTEQETAKLINETATSDKKFVTAMKQLSMGPANLLVELTMRHNGIALNDKSFMSLPVKKREAILAQILALSSSTYTEGKGVEALGSGAAESSLVDSFLDLLPFDTESEMTLPEQRRPSLGRRGRGAGSWNR